MEIEFYDGVFFLELIQCINFTVSLSGASLLRTPPRIFTCMRAIACAAHPAWSPIEGCESDDSCPVVCAGTKLNIHHVHPERAAASRAGAGAPHASMRLVGHGAQPRRSPLLARRRTVRDSLNGIRRARAGWMFSRYELYHRALLFGCTFGLTRRGPWRVCCSCLVSCQ